MLATMCPDIVFARLPVILTCGIVTALLGFILIKIECHSHPLSVGSHAKKGIGYPMRVLISIVPSYTTQITRVSGTSGQSVRITLEQHGTEKTLEGSHVLVAAGRTPNTEGLGLEVAGVEVTDRGYIRVNERLQTTAPGVWAIGEVAGSPQFTHISVDDFRVVHDNLIGVDRV